MKIFMKTFIKTFIRYCCLLSLLSGFSLFAQNIPNLGSSSDLLWSKSDEQSIGKAAYDQLLRQGHILQDQSDLDYLNYLGNKIGTYANTRLGLTFYLTRSRTINAFASPGAYVGINAGLVLATDNEHELAGVLGHEIAHVAQEHIARSILAAQDRRLANMAGMVAGVLMSTAGDSPDAGMGILSGTIASERQQQINDIRRHEIEADRIGRRLMTNAGFDERGMQSFFGKLQKPVNADAIPAYLLTHPLPLDRQAAIDQPGKSRGKLRSSDEYYLFRARIRAKMLNKTRLTQIIATEKQSKQPQLRDAARYLSALQQMKFGQFTSALQTLGQMQTSMKSKRDVQLLRAKLYLLNKQASQAEKIYQKLWQRYNGDSVVAYDYARFLSNKGNNKKAAKLLERQLNASTLNPQLYALYGRILGRLGERVKQHRILIRYYQQSGDYEKALAQAQVAAATPNLDWQSRSLFEAKQKELQAIVERLKNE